MSLIRPFAALRPAPGHESDVAAPPYDVLSSEEARTRAEGKPWSFLHVSKAEIDLPPGTDPHSPQVYAQAASNLQRMLDQGVLLRDDGAYYYVYRISSGTHVQTGIVAAASVAAYETDRIRRHEFTRPDKEDDRVRQIEALNAQTGPVLLAYRSPSAVEPMLADAVRGDPDMHVVADDGVHHTIWTLRDPEVISALTDAFEAMPALYIADGHHRSAAAARVAAARRAGARARDESHEYFLAVIFPHQEMRILDYNRVVRDLNGHDVDSFLAAVSQRFALQPQPRALRAEARGEYGMYCGGQWFRLKIRDDLVPADDPVARLDVSLLQDHLLAPVLGIGDPRVDQRIDFVGGSRGLQELERRVDSGEMAVAFALHATSMDDLVAVSDAGRVMPPKSTWFEPKLADGLLSHVLD